MSNENDDNLLADAINNMTEKMSHVLLAEFKILPQRIQKNIVLIKSAQLLLANILCHVVMDKGELEIITDKQGDEIKELTFDCANTAFSDKFKMSKH